MVILTYVSTWLCLCHSIHLPFILWQGEKRGGFNVCLYLAFPVTPFILWQGEKGGVGFNICLYMALPLSFILWQGEKGGGFNVCLYLACPLSLFILSQGEKGGVVLTYVSTWLSLCRSIHLIARSEAGNKNIHLSCVKHRLACSRHALLTQVRVLFPTRSLPVPNTPLGRSQHAPPAFSTRARSTHPSCNQHDSHSPM